MADAKHLRRTLQQLIDGQADDQRLRDHLEGVARDEYFPGLTWFWGPILYSRNRAIFRGLILSRFSNWQGSPLRRSWKRVPWGDHVERLQPWLDAARANRDTQLVRRLLRWKYAAKKWGIDAKSWNAALRSDFASAPSAAARAIVLDEYDDWFQLDEDTSLALYRSDPSCGAFILRHLPQTFWGGEKRKLWDRLSAAAGEGSDEELRFELYRKQTPVAQWRADVLLLAQKTHDPHELVDELQQRHLEGYGLKQGDTLIKLLEMRGRDVMPYVRDKLKDLFGGWYGNSVKPFVKLAEQKNWWDLWAAAIRVSRDGKFFNSAVPALLDNRKITEQERIDRLGALAGVSREWNWSGFGFAQVHTLNDDVATKLYRRYPELIHGPYKPNITPTWWQGMPKLLGAAQLASDDDLVDLMASRYVTQVRYEHAYYGGKERDRIIETAESLGEAYESLRDSDRDEFARRAANVLTRIPAFAIHSYPQLLKTNKLARLLFVRSFDAFLAVPTAVRDLVEGSEIHVQMLAYRILAQDDDRARQLAVETLNILIGTLLRPLHRKTRLAAFGALLNAARADSDSAATILERAREAIRLPDKKYPKERLIGLIGEILHIRPDLRGVGEQPVIYRLEEVVA